MSADDTGKSPTSPVGSQSRPANTQARLEIDVAARTAATRSGPSFSSAPGAGGGGPLAMTSAEPGGTSPVAGGQGGSTAPLDIPEHLGPYKVIRLLGEGGMGKVYLGHDEKLDRPVAIKVLAKELAADRGLTERFLLEARAIAKLTHPNIVAVYYADEDAGICFFAMECVQGSTLDELIRTQGAMDVGSAVAIIAQAAQGLEAALARGILHRDIKPSNLILDHEGQVKLLDFGLAKDLQSSTSHTSTGMFLGTPRYMSPEQGRGKRPDFRSDMYSLGVTFYEAIAGSPPFDGDTPLAVIDKHVHEPTPNILSIRQDIPIPVVGVIERMLAKDPDQRHASYAALLADLSAAAGSIDLSTARTAVTRPVLVSPPARSGPVSGLRVASPSVAGPSSRAVSGARPAGPAMSRPRIPTVMSSAGTSGHIAGAPIAPPGAPTPPTMAVPAGERFPLDDLVSSLATPRTYFEGAGRDAGALRAILITTLLSVLTGGYVILLGGPPKGQMVQLLAVAAVAALVSHGLARLLSGQGALRQTLTIEAAGLPAIALATGAFLPAVQGRQALIAVGAICLVLHMRTRWTGLSVIHGLRGGRLLLPFVLGTLLAFGYVAKTVAAVRLAESGHATTSPAPTVPAPDRHLQSHAATPAPSPSPIPSPSIPPSPTPLPEPTPTASPVAPAPAPPPPPPRRSVAPPPPPPPSPAADSADASDNSDTSDPSGPSADSASSTGSDSPQSNPYPQQQRPRQQQRPQWQQQMQRRRQFLQSLSPEGRQRLRNLNRAQKQRLRNLGPRQKQQLLQQWGIY